MASKSSRYKRQKPYDEEEEKPSREQLRLLEKPITSFIPGEDVDGVVLAYYVGKFIDREATIKPGPHWENPRIFGYWMNARYTLNVDMILDIKLDTEDWNREKRERARERGNEVSYNESATARARNKQGATIPEHGDRHIPVPQVTQQSMQRTGSNTMQNIAPKNPASQFGANPAFQYNSASRQQGASQGGNIPGYGDYSQYNIQSPYSTVQRTNTTGYSVNTARMDNTTDQGRNWNMQQRADAPGYNPNYPQQDVQNWADAINQTPQSPAPSQAYAESTFSDPGYGSIQNVERSHKPQDAGRRPPGTLPSTTGTAGFSGTVTSGPGDEKYRPQQQYRRS